MKRLVPAAIVLCTIGCATTEDERGTAEVLRGHVEFLASDDLLGRQPGTPGIAQAETYIANAFAAAHLEPLPGHNDYFLRFDLHRHDYDAQHTTVTFRGGTAERRGTLANDFRPVPPTAAAGEIEAAVVFAGFGITLEGVWDDYAGLDVQGRIVLVLTHVPGERNPDKSVFGGDKNNHHALFDTKGRNARDHGAVGMIVVSDPLGRHPEPDLRIVSDWSLTRPEPMDRVDDAADFPAVQVSNAMAEVLLAAGGHDLAKLQEAVEDGRSPAEFDLGTARARIAVEPIVRTIEARNVAGILEGSDAALKDQWVVVGAHHDHLGGYASAGDTVWNGANDNASGTAAVLELARAMAQAPRPQRRSVVFLTFSAEEDGQLGSQALIEQSLLPVARIAFLLNLDMVGCNTDDPLTVYGDGFVPGLRAFVERANAGPALDLRFAGEGYTDESDHDTFCRSGIPFMLATSGHDGCSYHGVDDHADGLDYPRLARIVELARNTVDALACARERPVLAPPGPPPCGDDPAVP